MAIKLKNIFLSASIPLADRDPKYFDTADNTAIRDAIIALSRIVLPRARLIWGGHPSITPLIRIILETKNIAIQNHITLYQSEFFSRFFPKENNYFENIQRTTALTTKEDSLAVMREEMIAKNNFCAGIFIGGMEGVEEEYLLFKQAHPHCPTFLLASTGAAAKLLYQQENVQDERLLTEFCYLPLFDELFEEILNGK